MGRVELAKQIRPLTEAQRTELVERLYNLNESAEKIQRRGESVVLTESYGTIAFQYWVADEVVLGSIINETLYKISVMEQRRRQNLDDELDARINKRIRELRGGSTSEAKERDAKLAALAGLEDAGLAWRRRLQEIRNRERAQHKRRFAYASKVLRALSLEDRKKVLDKAVEEKIIERYDNVMVENIHLFPEIFYKIVEAFAFTV